MKFTLSWLKDYLDTNATADEISRTLTSVGLEVEEVVDKGALYAPFKTVHVLEAIPHPEADRLRVCKVDTGSEIIQIVCGAPNARAGMKAILAPIGSYVPALDTVMKKGTIRGQESCGMMVSEREMGLSDESEGIIDLPLDTPIGTNFADLFYQNDVVFDISLTPNRADCTGVFGIARDLAAAGLGVLRPVNPTNIKTHFESPFQINIQNPQSCPHFCGRLIRNVQNGNSPAWLQARLKAVGLRSISVLVDITNYFTIAFGRPLHVYDADKLQGHIHVRAAKQGEQFLALNDNTYMLKDGMIAICDDRGVIGLGGIMGGRDTGVDENTKHVFVESAWFDPLTIARAGRDLQIISDARYRFERGVDPASTLQGLELATAMITQLCATDNLQIGSVIEVGSALNTSRLIDYTPARILQILGFEIDKATQKRILTALGCRVTELDNTTWTVKTPTWRHDIEGQADLVEEIGRIHGYDHLPILPIQNDHILPTPPAGRFYTQAKSLRALLCAQGLMDSLSWSFMKPDTARLFGFSNDGLVLSNPISQDLSVMRPSILPNLIDAVSRNSARGFGNAALFEVGPIFYNANNDGQKNCAAGVRSGQHSPKHWSNTQRPVDIYDVKNDAILILTSLGMNASSLQIQRNAPNYYHPGRSGSLILGKTILGYFGEIHPEILREMGIKDYIVAFEIMMDDVPQKPNKGTARPNLSLSAFQPVWRDFAFIVARDVQAESLIKAVRGADRKLIDYVDIFDIYQGDHIDADKKSVAISVMLQPVQETLNDAQLDAISNAIIQAVEKQTGGCLRA